MTREEIIAIAGEPVGYNYIGHFGFRPGLHPDEKALYTADQLVAAVLAEREECAKVAEVRFSVMKETEAAHYRVSDRPFNPSNFGFDLAVVEESRAIADAIRARGNHV